MTQATPGEGGAPATTYVYSTKTGAAEQVPTDSVPELVRSGRYGFAPEQRVDVVGADGRLETLDARQAADRFSATSAAGLHAQVITPGQAQGARDAEEYGSLGQQLRTGAEGAADAATLGLYSKALEYDGRAGDYRKRAEINPNSRIAGEIAGIAGTAALTGGGAAARGTGLFGKAAYGADVAVGAIPRGVAAAGEAGAGLFGRGAVAMGAADGGAVARGAALIGRSAVEGSIYGVGNAVSESVLKSDPLTIDKIVAGAVHGGALGAGMGLGLAVGGAALSRIASKGGNLLGNLTQASKLTELAGEIADVHTVKALSASRGGTEIKNLVQSGKLERVAARARAELPEIGGKRFSQMDRTELFEATEKGLEIANAERAKLLEEVDRLGTIKPDIAKIAAETRTIVAEYSRGANRGVGQKLEREISELEKNFQGSGFKELQHERTAIDGKIKQFQREASPADKAYLAYRRVVEDEIKSAGDRAMAGAGSSGWSARYQASKDRVADYISLRKLAETGAVGDIKNLTGGLREHFGGLGGAALGGTAGGALGGPVGAFVGQAAGGLIGGAAANYVRRYGSQHIAEIASKAANSDVLRAIVAHVNNTMGTGVAKAMGTTHRPAASLLSPMIATVAHETSAPEKRTGPQRYAERKAEIVHNLSTPARLEAWARQMAPSDEDMRMKLLQKAIAREQFLASKLPVLAPKPTFDPHAPDRDPAPAVMDKFLRYQRAADDPMTVFSDLEKNRVSRESVEAVKAIYPALYDELRSTVTEHVMRQAKPPTYQQQIQLAVLLGMPARAAFQPENIAAYQALISTPTGQEKKQDQTSDSGPKRPIRIDNSTTATRIEQGADK